MTLFEKDLSQIEHVRDPLLYNSMVLENYVRLIKTRYPEIDILAVLKKVRIELWELADPAQWFSQKQYNALHDELNRHFPVYRDITLAREAGRFAGTERSKRLLRDTTYSFLSPTRAFDVFGDIARRLSRAADYQSRRLGENQHQIILTYKKGVTPSPFQCQNYTGYMEAIYFLFERKWPRISHPKCTFRGDECCSYVISWERSLPQTLALIRNHLMVICAAGVLAAASFNALRASVAILVIAAIICLALSLSGEFLERRNFFNRLRRQRVSPKEKVEGYDRFYNFAKLFNEISKHLSKHTDIGSVVEKLSQILKGLSYERGLILLIDQKQENAPFIRSFGFPQHLGACLQAALEPCGSQFRNLSMDFKKALLVTQPDQLPDCFPSNFKKALMIFSELIFIPMTYENSALGFFMVENKAANKPLMASDVNLLTTLGAQTALSIMNIAAFEELLRNEQLKNEFITIASHELRTPIQIILLALEELQNALSGEHLNKISMELRALNESAQRLEHIVRDILDISRLEAGRSKLRIRRVRVADLIASVQIETDALVQARGHRISFHQNNVEDLLCDPNLIVQTLQNLIGNAAKYTPENGRIVCVFKTGKGGITIECIDNGIGIPKIYHEKIFMKFFQVEEDGAQDKSGCGLGLSLCQEIIKKHGGYIAVESPLDPSTYPDLALGAERKGAKFSIHLKPLQQRPETVTCR